MKKFNLNSIYYSQCNNNLSSLVLAVGIVIIFLTECNLLQTKDKNVFFPLGLRLSI